MKKQRKHYAPEEKVAILRRHLLEKEFISKLCNELGLQPTVFYRWQKEFFENGASTFEQKVRLNHSADQERIAYLSACQWHRRLKSDRVASLRSQTWRSVIHICADDTTQRCSRSR